VVDLCGKVGMYDSCVESCVESCAAVGNIVSHSSRTKSRDPGNIEEVLRGFG